MLVLARRKNERIKIGKDIEIVITEIKPDLVRIGIIAPREVAVFRSEVYEAIEQANLKAALGTETIQILNTMLIHINSEKQ